MSILIIISLVTMIVLGYVVGRTSATPSGDSLTVLSSTEYRFRKEIQELQSGVANLEYENSKKLMLIRDHRLNCYPCHCSRPVYAETPDKQEVIDLLLKMTPPLEELKKKFGI